VTVTDGRDTVSNFERPKEIVALSGEKGLYILGLADSVPAKFLIDTGSSITVISHKIFDKFSSYLPLEPVKFDVVQADGKTMEVVGQFQADVTVGPMRVNHPLVIGDITVDGILGMDFLRVNECSAVLIFLSRL
jgi:hypothetical protein